MTWADVEKHLLSLPGATLSIQWGNDRVFKVGGKMFAVVGGGGVTRSMSFKTSDDSFEILTQSPGFTPAPYLARAKWVQIDGLKTLKSAELKAYLTRAHAIVASGLTKKAQAALFPQKEESSPGRRAGGRARPLSNSSRQARKSS